MFQVFHIFVKQERNKKASNRTRLKAFKIGNIIAGLA